MPFFNLFYFSNHFTHCKWQFVVLYLMDGETEVDLKLKKTNGVQLFLNFFQYCGGT